MTTICSVRFNGKTAIAGDGQVTLGEKVIAKAPNYRFGKILLKCGADKIIFPERDMGFRLANNLSNDYLLDANEISKGYTIYDLKASPKMNGK